MDNDKCNKFIGSLTKYLQSLCHSYVEFNNGVDLVGHIYLHIDTGEKIDYVLNESVLKNGSNVVKFTSNSYHAQPVDKNDKRDPPKKAPDPSRKDDDDVIILGSEASRRRRGSTASQSSQQPQASTSQPHSGSGTGCQPGQTQSSAGVFRHPRAPNPRMAAPAFSASRSAAYPYPPRRRIPGPQQPRSFLPMSTSGYNPRLRPPPYQARGVAPVGGRGSFPVPSDIGPLRREYPPVPGQSAVGGSRTGDPTFRHPFHPRPSVPLSMQQGPLMAAPVRTQGHGGHLSSVGTYHQSSVGTYHQSSVDTYHQSSIGSHMPSVGSRLPPPMSTHRFMPPYPLGSHGQRMGSSMTLPVNTQPNSSMLLHTSTQPNTSTNHTSSQSNTSTHHTSITSTYHTSSQSSTSTHRSPTQSNTSTSTSAPSSMMAPATSTVMIKGRPVPIPASLTASTITTTTTTTTTTQLKPPVPEGRVAKLLSEPSSSSSCLHPSRSSGSSSVSGGNQAPITTHTTFNTGPVLTSSLNQPALQHHALDGTNSSSSAPSAAGDFPLASVASSSATSSLAGISLKGRPSTPALEQCAANKSGLSPRVSGAHYHFLSTSSSSQSSGEGNTLSSVSGAPASVSVSAKVRANSPTPSNCSANSAVSPRVSGTHFPFPPVTDSTQAFLPGGARSLPNSSGGSNSQSFSSVSASGSSLQYSSLPGGSSTLPYSSLTGGENSQTSSSLSGNDSSQPYPSFSGSGSSLPYSSMPGNIPSFPPISGASQSHSANGSNLHSPRLGEANIHHSPRGVEASRPYMGSGNLPHHTPGSSLHSPRAGDRLPTFGDLSNLLSYPPATATNLHSPRGGEASRSYFGSANLSHPAGGSNLHSPRTGESSNLHSPRGGESSRQYFGSATASGSNLHSPRASDRNPFGDMGSSSLSHPPLSAGNLHSPRAGEGSRPYLGSSLSYPPLSVNTGNLHSPRGSDRSQLFSDMSNANLHHHPVSGSNLHSPRAAGSDRNNLYGPSSVNTDSTRSFSSLTGGSTLQYSPGSASSAPFSSFSHTDPFNSVSNSMLPVTSVSGSNVPFPSLNDNDLPFPSMADSSNSYSSVQNGRVPFSSLSGSSHPYPTFGDLSFNPPGSGTGTNLSFSAMLAQDMPTDLAMNSQGSGNSLSGNGFSGNGSGSTRQSDSMFDMYNQQAQTDGLGARYNQQVQTTPLHGKPQASDLSSSMPYPPALSHHAPFSLDQGVGEGDGFSDLVSELRALNQQPLNQPLASPTDRMMDPSGASLSQEPYPQNDVQGSDPASMQPGMPEDDDRRNKEPAQPRTSDYEADENQADSGQDNVSPDTTASGSQESSETAHSDGNETFLAPYEIGNGTGGGQAGGEEYRKRSGSMSSHSHETPSPSPRHETVGTETKPQGQTASDYDSGCDSASTSTGERLSSPQGQPQSTSHPPLKSLTIPLVPVDSPSSSARQYIKQERPVGEGEDEGEGEGEDEANPLPEKPPQAEVPKDIAESEWMDEDMAALNHSDSTESYSEGDDPDYRPERPAPRANKGSVKRGRNKKTERNNRGKRRKVDKENMGGETGNAKPGKVNAQTETQPPSELPDPAEVPAQPETEDRQDRYDPGMFLLLNMPDEIDRNGRHKPSHVPAEVISTPEGETEGLWVHTLVPAGHGLWRLPPDEGKRQGKVDPKDIVKTLYKVTVKIVAGKVLYKFDDM